MQRSVASGCEFALGVILEGNCNAAFRVAYHDGRCLAERDRFTDWRAYVGAKRSTAERNVDDLAITRLPGRKNELVQSVTAGQPRTRPNTGRLDFAAFDIVCDHLRKPCPLRFREVEFDAQTKPVMAHDLSLETPKAIDIEDRECAHSGRAGGFEAGAIGREIADDAFLFPFAFVKEDFAFDADWRARTRATFATRKTEPVLVSIR